MFFFKRFIIFILIFLISDSVYASEKSVNYPDGYAVTFDKDRITIYLFDKMIESMNNTGISFVEYDSYRFYKNGLLVEKKCKEGSFLNSSGKAIYIRGRLVDKLAQRDNLSRI
jgi:hypothetical protein